MRARIIVQRRWDLRPPLGGTAVVIDVIRFSTTLCALLKSHSRRVWVARDPHHLGLNRGLARGQIYSELEFDAPGRRFDNSPAQALAAGRSNAPAFVTTTTGSKAIWASRRAERVLIGCFANFDAVVRRLERVRDKIWLVPAAAPFGRNMIEDDLCAEAFEKALAGDRSAAQTAVDAVRGSPRIDDFLRFRPDSGTADLKLCLAINRFPWLPVATFPRGAPAGVARIRRAHR